MNVRIQTGKGVTGALRYVQGEGRDPKTGVLKELTPGAQSRAELLSGTGFGFEITTEAHAELARRMMEFAALNQASKTKKCEQDCVTIELNWARGEKASNQEKVEAARAALASIGMSNAMALVYAHHDEDYEHIHIVASKINPATGRAYDLAESWRKSSEWAEEYERQLGGIINTRRETANELRRAIRQRDAEGVLEAMTKRRSTFTAKELERAIQKEIHWKMGATPEQKRRVELHRAEFVNAVLSHANVVRLAEKLEPSQPWMSSKGGLAALSDEYRQSAERSYDRWSEANPRTAARHDLADYVQYVQDKWAAQEQRPQPLGLRYTTKSVIEAENHVLRAANGLTADRSHGLEDRRRAQLLSAEKYGTIAREQVRAFRHATGAEGLALIDGQAGTGKSFTMTAIREAYEAAGHRVIGLAPTNKVAKNMANDGFGDAKTVHSELFALNNGRTQWDAKTVVMIDETAMLDTKLMAMVTAHAHDAGAKLILVGDDRQLSSIDRGGMFGVLKDRHGAAELTEVRRQRKVDDRRASEMMAEGNFHDALGIYEEKAAINWTSSQREARAELVEQWAKDSAAGRDKSRFVFAYTNGDVNLLNADLRQVRKHRGELEWQDHALDTAHGRFEFSAGDRIQFTATDKQAGISNGAVGTILVIDGTHLAVLLDGTGGRAAQTINFDAASFNGFRHGYAGTIYKGQGDTLDQTYLYHSEHWRAAPAYVALTRHREDMTLFVARSTAKNVGDLARQVARQDETRAASQFYQLDPIGPVRPMNAEEILAHFAGEDFARTAERMEREGRHWPARDYNPMPRPPWPSLRERQAGYYRHDNDPPDRMPRGEQLDADLLAERVQQIIDDPTREADERDERVLQALYLRREQEQMVSPVEDVVAGVETSEEPDAGSSAEQEEAEVDFAITAQELTDGKQVQYSRFTASTSVLPAGKSPVRHAGAAEDECDRDRSRGTGAFPARQLLQPHSLRSMWRMLTARIRTPLHRAIMSPQRPRPRSRSRGGRSRRR